MARLQTHGTEALHTPYICVCGKKFSRHADLDRHYIQYIDMSLYPGFPCTYCKKYRGDKAFRRKDHLTQHIRNYHLIGVDDQSFVGGRFLPSCPHIECPEYRDVEWHVTAKSFGCIGLAMIASFPTTTAYREHMRQVHNESPFPCGVPGCPKIAGKGYFRKTDMLKHRKKEHSEAPPLNAADVHAVIKDVLYYSRRY